jgi:hypothetical protein
MDDSGPIFRLQCMCKTTYAHDRCLLQCLKGKENVCMVCRRSYNNVVTAKFMKKKANSLLVCVMCSITFLVCGLSFTLFYYHMFLKVEAVDVFSPAMVLVSLAMVILPLIVVLHKKDTESQEVHYSHTICRLCG